MYVFRTAFGSFSAWVGIILGAISLMNLGLALFDFGVGQVLAEMLGVYRAMVYPIGRFFFNLTGWVFNADLVDVATLYIVIMSACVRTTAAMPKHPVYPMESDAFVIFLAVSILWPLMLTILLIFHVQIHSSAYKRWIKYSDGLQINPAVVNLMSVVIMLNILAVFLVCFLLLAIDAY